MAFASCAGLVLRRRVERGAREGYAERGGEGRRRKGKEGRRKTRGGKEGVGDMNHHGLNALDHGWSAC